MDTHNSEFLGALAGTREAQTGVPSRIGSHVWFSRAMTDIPEPGVIEDESPDGKRLAIRNPSGVLFFVTNDHLSPF